MAETSIERRGITYATANHAVLHMLELAYGVLLVAIGNELGISLLILGVLANVFGLTYGITALPTGVLADRIRAPKLLGVSSIAMGLTAIGVGLSQNTVTLGVSLSLFGVALGVFHPVANSFVSKIATKVGLGFAYMGIGGNLGLAFGPIAIGVIAAAFSWRVAYASMAIPCIVLGILFLRFRYREAASEEAPAYAESARTSLREFRLPLIVVVILGVVNGLIYRGVVTFMPTHLSTNVHMGGTAADLVLRGGSFTTFALLFGVVGQFIGGWLSDRWKSEWIVLLATAVTIPALAAVWQMGNVALLAAASVFAFFHFMAQPVLNALVSDYTPVMWRGRVFGVYFFCAMVGGSFSASALGYVAETSGIEQVFFMCTAFAVLATVFSIPLVIYARRRGWSFRVVEMGRRP